MSLSPGLLQRLKELKKWQESQEELFKKSRIFNTSANVTTASDYQTIDGLSAFDSPLKDEKSIKNWESQIISPTKNFNELLEEKLAQDPGPEAVEVDPKPKKPFLRKGAGLERFRLKPRPKVTKKSKKPVRIENHVTPLRAPDLSVRPKATWSKIDDSGDHIAKINALAKLDDKPEPGEQTLYEKALEKELLIFEALEERAENSSFCSTNSSVLRIMSSTPSKIKPIPPETKKVHWEPQSSEDEDVIETNLERKDIAEILLRLKNLAQNNIKTNVPSIIEESDEEKWSSTTEASSDVTSISSADLEMTLKTEKRDIGVGTTENLSADCAICGDKLKEKISEYEEKIQNVIEDRNRICEIKRELEKKERDFGRKKREFEDEKQSLLFELESEKKNLMREKQAYQTYVKDSQNRPTKKERQEISNLKQEVADLTETLKLKESKTGMTQARLRNQIKQLEKENSNLKDEIEKLTKENAKLSASQKLNRKSSDSKILQEINKNITKLAQESKKKTKNKNDDDNGDEEVPTVQKSNRTVILDTEDSFLEMTTRNHVNLEAEYENTFRNQSFPKPINENFERTPEDSMKQDKYPNRSIKRKTASPIIDNSTLFLEDGSKQTLYPNGNVKIVSPDGNLITVKYFNGDKQETNLLDGTVKYYFTNKNICQTTYADGLEVVDFPDGIKEKRYTDGKSEVILPDGVVQTTFPDGTQETKYTDGSIVNIKTNGDKILLLPNGQKEIETSEYKSREYPDGTVKTLYPDGTQETKYSNGRVRIKDKNGTLIMDMHS